MTTATELRRRIAADAHNAHLKYLQLDHAIVEIRRLRAVDRQYHEGNHGK